MTVAHVPEIWVRNMSDISKVFKVGDIFTFLPDISETVRVKFALSRYQYIWDNIFNSASPAGQAVPKADNACGGWFRISSRGPKEK